MTSHIFGRSTAGSLPVAAKGDGCYIVDTNGKRYFDGSGGAAVSCLGHSDADVTAAIKEQVDRIAFAHTGFFTSEPAEDLANLLVEHAPEGIDRVYFVSGGSEAVEAAIKLARSPPELGGIVTNINDTGQRYFTTALCGEEKHVEIPERDHAVDAYSAAELDKYAPEWEIIT